VVFFQLERATSEGLTKSGAVAVLEEARTQLDHGFLDADTKRITDTGALFLGSLMPDFQGASGRTRRVRFKASGMHMHPKQREVSHELFAKDALEVCLEIGLPGQGVGIAEDAKIKPVGANRPETRILGIKVFLCQLAGGPLAVSIP
jgi:hypothetical protein